jgi:hypothetical protein
MHMSYFSICESCVASFIRSVQIAMEAYPAKEAIAAEAWKHCQVNGCGKSFASFKSLERHICKDHKVSNKDMSTHWVHQAVLRERRGGDLKIMGILEPDYVDLAYDVAGAVKEAHFKCKLCDKELLKSSCLTHMTDVHALHKTEIHTWLTYADGEKFRKLPGNKKKAGETVSNERLYLTAAMLRHVVDKGSAEGLSDCAVGGDAAAVLQIATVADSDAGGAADVVGALPVSPKFMQPTPKCMPKIAHASPKWCAGRPSVHVPVASQSLAASSHQHQVALPTSGTTVGDVASLHEVVKNAVASTLEETCFKRVPTPTLELKPEWEAWRPDDVARERNQCPIALDDKFDLAPYAQFLKTVRRLDPDSTCKDYVMGMQRLLGMLNMTFDDSRTASQGPLLSYVGVAVALQRKQLVHKIFDLPVMREPFSWCRPMRVALQHFLTLAKESAITNGFNEDHKVIEALSMSMAGLTKSHSESKSFAELKKKQKDAERLEQLPTKAESQTACRQAMYDIFHLKQITAGQSALTPKQRAAANTIIIGLIHCNGKAGRCGEWTAMKMADVRKAILEDKSDWLIAERHKTGRARGPCTKVLAPGTVKAIEIFLDLPGQSQCELFLQPARRTTKGSGQTVAKYITRFDKVYFGRVCHYGSNLCRKKDDSNAWEHAIDHYKKLHAWAGMHSLPVTENTYVALTPRRKADIDRQLLSIEIEPVGWPSDEIMASMSPVFFAPAAARDDGNSSSDFELEPWDIDEDEDNPPPLNKKVRLVGFASASSSSASGAGGPSASSSSGGPAAAAVPNPSTSASSDGCRSGEVNTGEKIYLLSQVASGGEFRWPAPDVLQGIITAGIEDGSLRTSLKPAAIVRYLKEVQESVRAEGSEGLQ